MSKVLHIGLERYKDQKIRVCWKDSSPFSQDSVINCKMLRKPKELTKLQRFQAKFSKRNVSLEDDARREENPKDEIRPFNIPEIRLDINPTLQYPGYQVGYKPIPSISWISGWI